MLKVLRFCHVFLEEFFKRIYDDGFSGEKAFVAMGCAEIALLATLANTLVLSGVVRLNLHIGFGLAVILVLLITVFHYRVVKAAGGLKAYRISYKNISSAKKLAGGIVVVCVTVSSVAAGIITSSMVARLQSQMG